jgi:hypothetical protein
MQISGSRYWRSISGSESDDALDTDRTGHFILHLLWRCRRGDGFREAADWCQCARLGDGAGVHAHGAERGLVWAADVPGGTLRARAGGSRLCTGVFAAHLGCDLAGALVSQSRRIIFERLMARLTPSIVRGRGGIYPDYRCSSHQGEGWEFNCE